MQINTVAIIKYFVYALPHPLENELLIVIFTKVKSQFVINERSHKHNIWCRVFVLKRYPNDKCLATNTRDWSKSIVWGRRWVKAERGVGHQFTSPW